MSGSANVLKVSDRAFPLEALQSSAFHLLLQASGNGVLPTYFESDGSIATIGTLLLLSS